MPAGLERIYGQGHLHFITFSCYQRLPLLRTVRARDIFVQELGKLRDEMAFHLIGYVVMPEHVHLLLSEPPRGTPSAVLQKLKLRIARKMRERTRAVSAGQLRLRFEEQGGIVAGVLAGAFLRFQRVQPGEEDGEVALYAREASDSRAGETSQGLAVEQLVVL